MISEILLLLFTILWITHHRRKSKLPPGPFSLPVIGTIQLHLDGAGAGAAMSPKYYKYGDLYTIHVATMPLIIINNIQLAKELFSKDEFSGNTF